MLQHRSSDLACKAVDHAMHLRALIILRPKQQLTQDSATIELCVVVRDDPPTQDALTGRTMHNLRLCSYHPAICDHLPQVRGIREYIF